MQTIVSAVSDTFSEQPSKDRLKVSWCISVIWNASLSHDLLLQADQGTARYGFELNPYDPCVANKMVNGEQLTVCWQVDDLTSSHIDPKVNAEFLQWI